MSSRDIFWSFVLYIFPLYEFSRNLYRAPRSGRKQNMAEPAPAASEPIFNFNAYGPAEIQDAIEKVGVKKANMPFLPCFMLSAVAGGGIGLGALYYTIVA